MRCVEDDAAVTYRRPRPRPLPLVRAAACTASGASSQPPQAYTPDTLRRLDQCGEGNYGKVYRAEHVPTGRIVALKKMRSDVGVMRQFLREVALLQRVRHPNCVECLQIIPSPDSTRAHIIFEYVPISLLEYLRVFQLNCAFRQQQQQRQRQRHRTAPPPPSSSAVAPADGVSGNTTKAAATSSDRDAIAHAGLLPRCLVQTIVMDLLRAVAFLHARCVLHRDIKPENALVRLEPAAFIAGPVISRGEGGPSLLAPLPLPRPHCDGNGDGDDDGDGCCATTGDLFRALNDGELKDRLAGAAVAASLPHTPVVKLCDFGSSRVALPACAADGRPHTPRDIFTLPYRAPEVLLGGAYSVAADVWSLGCVLAEVATGRVLFCGPNDDATHWGHLMVIMEILGTPTHEEWCACCGTRMRRQYNPETFPLFAPALHRFHHGMLQRRLGTVGMDLLRRMLRYDPRARITAADALEHPFFTHRFARDSVLTECSSGAAVVDGGAARALVADLRMLRTSRWCRCPDPQQEQQGQGSAESAAAAAAAAGTSHEATVAAAERPAVKRGLASPPRVSPAASISAASDASASDVTHHVAAAMEGMEVA